MLRRVFLAGLLLAAFSAAAGAQLSPYTPPPDLTSPPGDAAKAASGLISKVLTPGTGSRKPEALARTLLANLPQLIDALENGSIVTFEPARVRVRLLPIGPRGGDE